MGDLSPIHLLIAIVVALVVLGPSRLPEAGAALGRTIREFRRTVSSVVDDVAVPTSTPPSKPPGGETTLPTPPPEVP
jgi:sec-independent protein translocase protein TatA